MKKILVMTASLLALTAASGTYAQSPTVSKGSARPQMESTQAGENWRERMIVPGTVSLMQSEIAVGKASHAKVMEFAKFETSEQNALGAVLKELSTKPAELSDQDKATLQKLKDMPKGPEFDKAYIAAQIEGHGKLAAANNSLLDRSRFDSTSGEANEERHLAMVIKPTITQHIANATEISKMLK